MHIQGVEGLWAVKGASEAGLSPLTWCSCHLQECASAWSWLRYSVCAKAGCRTRATPCERECSAQGTCTGVRGKARGRAFCARCRPSAMSTSAASAVRSRHALSIVARSMGYTRPAVFSVEPQPPVGGVDELESSDVDMSSSCS